MYRNGKAYHPAHPFYMWYWGEAARQHLGRVIAVGADNDRTPEILGYETAVDMQQAITMAEKTVPGAAEITMLHVPPLLLSEVI
jgi:hypothetical protein